MTDVSLDVELALAVIGDRVWGSVNGVVVVDSSDSQLRSGNILGKGSVGLSSSGAIGTTFSDFRVAKSAPALVNLARGRPTAQSDVGWSGHASRAVDGNTNTAYGGGSCTHTKHVNKAWWRVELAESQMIASGAPTILANILMALGTSDSDFIGMTQT